MATFEALRAKFRYDIDGGDVMLAGLLGGALGGSVGGVTTAFARNAKVKALAQKVALGEELTPDERAFYDANNVDALTQRIFDEVERRGDLEDMDTPMPKAVGQITTEEARGTSQTVSWWFLCSST